MDADYKKRELRNAEYLDFLFLSLSLLSHGKWIVHSIAKYKDVAKQKPTTTTTARDERITDKTTCVANPFIWDAFVFGSCRWDMKERHRTSCSSTNQQKSTESKVCAKRGYLKEDLHQKLFFSLVLLAPRCASPGDIQAARYVFINPKKLKLSVAQGYQGNSK